MKRLLSIVLLLHINLCEASWIVNNFVNESDISFDQAFRKNRKKEDVVIQSVTDLLRSKKRPVSLSSSSIGSAGGCAMKGRLASGKNATIVFVGNPTNKVANGRADNGSDFSDSSKRASRKAAQDMSAPRFARVVLKVEGVGDELLAYGSHSDESQKFDLYIYGKNGMYSGKLTKVK